LKKSNCAKPSLVRVSPDVALEHFGDKGVILLTSKDQFLTVNKAAASLLELIMTAFKERSFLDEDLSYLFLKHYQLTGAESRREARKIIALWLKRGIFVDGEHQTGLGRFS
jgi:hypothetical protein